MNFSFFNQCLLLAERAAKKNEVPIGALIVCNGKIISKAYNLREKRHDITAHAEILALKKASKRLNRWNLSDCDLYVTLEPCSMCNSVIKQARIKNVFYICGKLDYKKDFNKTKFQCVNNDILLNSYKQLLSSFFSKKR